jgi:hypothetical protein
VLLTERALRHAIEAAHWPLMAIWRSSMARKGLQYPNTAFEEASRS